MTQQTPSNPAIDFANAILEVTNNGLELIEILYDIAQNKDGDTATNERISATAELMDRGLGKAPKQINPNPAPAPTPESNDNDVGAIRESPSVPAANPRPVTQIKHALNDTFGPPPAAPNPLSLEGEGWGEGEKSALAHNSIHFTIQQHILDITNNGYALRDILLEIARAEDDPKITDHHRRRASVMLLNRSLAANPSAAAQTDPDDDSDEEFVPDPDWVAAVNEVKRMEDEGEIPAVEYDPFKPTNYWVPKEVVLPYAEEVAAKFMAELDLQAERRKAWPAIEERRRKKLAQIYPSHSEDQDDIPPET